MRQDISSSIYFVLAIINSEVVLGEFLGLVNLSRAQSLSVHKTIKVIVINEDKDFIAFQVMTPSLKGYNNSQELLIASFVPIFY